MASRFLRGLTRATAAVAVLGLLAASIAEARPVRRTARATAARGFNLFAGSVNVMMNVNRVQCNINNIGESCVDPTNSPSLAGGFWPKGSPNQYIFNSGLQIAGLIGGTDGPNFPWPGDTVGAFFFDPRGDQAHGEGRTNVFNALNADDLANWPTAAYINDPSLFNTALLGRKTVSQQDTWVRFWDGNTNLANGRQHPMGLLVEQRGLMWNFPSGNQDIVYFLYRFINITSKNAADYAGLAAAGYSAQDIADIVAIATEFQQRSEAAYNVDIPDGGYTFTNLFAAFAQDPDVTENAGVNYSSANLPFAIGAAYRGDFLSTSFIYPPDINGAPFANAPGFEGVKYLKSPQNIGIAMFGNTTNGGAFPDSRGVQQLWRRLSANLTPADGTCSVPNPAVRHFCFIGQAPDDTRFFQSSGPFSLAPGQSDVIVVAYIHAAPLASQPAATPPFGSALPAVTLPIGGDMKPNLPLDGARLFAGQDSVKTFDRIIGWTNHTNDLNGNNAIDQNEVITAPRSLLNKALVAQAVFDNKFLLPFAPEVPLFFLVPGDNQVTIAWQKSETEIVGDPFFGVASNVASPLYDANFRKFDVEGYRIWRGRTESEMQVVASFDYSGTTITDFTGQFFNNADYGNRCAPELGVTTTCPTFPHAVPLSGEVMQIPQGGRIQLASGAIFNTVVDTAVIGGGSGLPGLVDNGVPFAYIDRTVRNGFRYFYAVTAFDVNSVKSGPTSLESPLVTKTVTPRAPSSNNVSAVIVTGIFGGDGTELNPNTPYPSVDPATGTFNGPVPPTNGGSIELLAAVTEALGPGDYTVRIDSLSPGSLGGLGTPGNTLYYTMIAGSQSIPGSLVLPQPSFATAPDALLEAEFGFPLIPYDSTRSRLLGIAFTQDARMPIRFAAAVQNPSNTASGVALQGGRFGETNSASRYFGFSRWYDEGGSEPPNPTISPFATVDHTSGKLTGVTRMWTPIAYRMPVEGERPSSPANVINTRARSIQYTTSTPWYPADFVVTWGAGGTITVRDSTHRTSLSFNPAYGVGYGFSNSSVHVAAGITQTNLCGADGLGTFNGTQCTGAAQPGVVPTVATMSYRHLYYHYPANLQRGLTRRDMQNTAQIQALDLTGDGIADGNGIALTINGETWFMEMAALPAAGTKWHLRAIGGDGLNATCTPALAAPLLAAPTSCSGWTFAPTNPTRPPYAPGLKFTIRVAQAFSVASNSGDLSAVHTVPDPYYVTNALEQTANTKILRFVNLPDRAVIRIYSTSGILVAIVNHNNPQGGGEATWNLRNRNNQFVASGVYFYHVEAPDGQTHVGRFTVVNFAQ